jgi:hypothetical protein
MSYAFLVNRLEFRGPLDIEVVPGHRLNRANADQQAQIKPFLSRFERLPWNIQNWYECRWIGEPKGFHFEPLDPSQFRYWVINFEGVNDKLEYLQFALNGLQFDCDIGFAVLTGTDLGPSPIMWRDASLIQLTASPGHLDEMKEPDPIQAENLAHDLTIWFTRIQEIEKQFPDIYRALREFDLIKCLPRGSRYEALWHFIVLELLITHNPENDFDTLTHQVKTKMPLLSRRFQRSLEITSFFSSQMEPEKLWAKLYAYRSCLAHGGVPNFKKELQALKTEELVFSFMKSAVKLLVLQAITEPQLLSDLKQC